jgi:import inner membrane translocase subunit TIM50
MLSRAAFRALRTRPLRASSVAPTSHWARTYASNTRRKDNTWKKADPIKFDEQNKARPNPVNPSEQPEFDTPASPEANTTPTEASRPIASAARTAQDVAKDVKMDEQEEMAGPKTPGENTDPTTESPEAQQQPQKPLPDLRQGIPSTFAAEFAKAEADKRDPNDPNVPEEALPGTTMLARAAGEAARSPNPPTRRAPTGGETA